VETVVSIIGTGQMAARAAELLAASATGELGLRLLDRDLRAAERAADRVRRAAPGVQVETGTVDALDVDACADAVASSDLVVLGAGPFLRTTEPVIHACVQARVDLLDIGDDAEAAQSALALEEEVADAGVCVSIGCGASPGLTNVLAADAADALDEVERIDVGWVVGDEGPQELGEAVLEHWVHCVAGACLTFRDGEVVEVDAFVAGAVLPFSGALGDFRVFECPHPEPLTLGRRYPGAAAIRCLGGLDPAPLTGLSRGVGMAVRSGSLSEATAVDFFRAATSGGAGPLRAWPPALAGVAAQVRRGEVSPGAALRWMSNAARGRSGPCRSGVVAVAHGRRDGEPATEVRSASSWSSLERMDDSTGAACAAFARLALRDRTPGVRAPEDWVTLPELREALDDVRAVPA